MSCYDIISGDINNVNKSPVQSLVVQIMINMVNLTLTEGLLYHVGQFTILINKNKPLYLFSSN